MLSKMSRPKFMGGKHFLPNISLESREVACEPRHLTSQAVVLPGQPQRNLRIRIEGTVLQENQITRKHSDRYGKPEWP